jgi:predicted nucleic acid-binding protein
MPAAERGKPNPAFFVDTNVLVYAFSAQDAAKRETARALAESAGAWVSTQVLSELASVLTRRFGVPAPEARERVASIAAGCEVMVVSPSVVLDAFRVMERWGYGFFDSQIIAAALACGASVLYSEDLHDGQTVDGRLAIRSPFRLRAEQRAKPYLGRRRRAGARAGMPTARRIPL